MRRTLATAAALSLAFTLAACGSEDTASDTASEATSPSESASAEASPSPSESTGGSDIVDTAVAGDFTTLATAIEAAGLVDTLKGDGPFTVFAPTDQAFEALPDGALDSLLADPNGALKNVLTYHVVSGEVMAADVLELDGQTVETVQGESLTVGVDGSNVSLTDASGNTVNVTQTDIEASNGVIHAIDGVLMPSS